MNSLFNGLNQPSFGLNDLFRRPQQHARENFQHPVFNSASGQATVPQSMQQTGALLENALSNMLSRISPANQVKTADFSPQAVADRIVDFVASAISLRAGSSAEAEAMLQQAKQGVAEGVAEAREILNSLGGVSNDIDSQISDTESLINKGLDELAQAPADAPQLSQQAQLISAAGQISTQYKQSSEASIEIYTQDGDRVEVSYSAFINAASEKSFSFDEQASSVAFESYNESSVAFQFKLQGEIDAEEQQAINSLLNDVGDIAKRFFSGDVQAAFNSALQLGFDSEEIKGFSVDLQQTTQVRVIEAYQYTEQLANPAEKLPDPGLAVDVLSQLQQLLQQAEEQALIQQPELTVKSMLNDMLELLEQPLDTPVKKYIEELVDAN